MKELGERLYAKITEVVIPEWESAFRELTEQDCIDYIYNLTINRTYDGYLREKSVINDDLAKIFSDITFECQVFPNMPRDASASRYIMPWMDKAGITRPITFHCSRHTFATMMLTLGADLYTVSKLLGHSKVETTQAYAKIVNKKKDDAVSLIDDAFAGL